MGDWYIFGENPERISWARETDPEHLKYLQKQREIEIRKEEEKKEKRKKEEEKEKIKKNQQVIFEESTSWWSFIEAISFLLKEHPNLLDSEELEKICQRIRKRR